VVSLSELGQWTSQSHFQTLQCPLVQEIFLKRFPSLDIQDSSHKNRKNNKNSINFGLLDYYEE
jgi:hypothetical protein